jgi:peroxiredoxin
MKALLRILFCFFIAGVSSGFRLPGEKSVHDFSLLNIDGKKISLKDFPDAKGFIVVFTCNHCPFAKLYSQRMNALNEKYKPLGIPLVAISSTDTVQYDEDSFIKMVEKTKNEKLTFPYLHDKDQAVAKDFGAQKTPHAFVIWKEAAGWTIRYNGAIDDNGAEPAKATHHYVQEAADALLAGKQVVNEETKSIGCQIHFRQ